ncbi:MAG: trypsin-like peptidase domain-containing protein [Dehalococcoidia bacterium]
MPRTIPPLMLMLALAALLVVAACTDETAATADATPTASAETPAPASTPAEDGEQTQPAQLQGAGSDFTQAVQRVVERVRPAVVQITNQQSARGVLDPNTIPAGVGSGVIYDDEGRILTNNHVIAGAQGLLVVLPDGRSFDAEVLGADPMTDLAVIQIQGDDLPTAELGDSSDLAVGEWVVAIGNALGLTGGPTVTAGVVGAVGRAIPEPGLGPEQPGTYLLDLIQTDAAINPGNSGGPLVNLEGEVVGLNTIGTGDAEGIGFAISTDTIDRIVPQLVEEGSAVHPYLGIRYGALNPAIANALGIETTSGLVIGEVVPGSPAAEAGLQAEDVITHVDGEELVGESALASAMHGRRPGDTVDLTVLRGGAETGVEVTLDEAP